MNIKCRKAGLAPDAVVIVATVRAMKMNGGVAKADLGPENVRSGKGWLCSNLGRHIEKRQILRCPSGCGDQPLRDGDSDAESRGRAGPTSESLGSVRRSCASTGSTARRA